MERIKSMNGGAVVVQNRFNHAEHVSDGLGKLRHATSESLANVVGRIKPESQLQVLCEDRDALGVYGAQIGVLEAIHEHGLRSLLKSQQGIGSKAKILFEILRNLPHEALERSHAKEKLRRLLVPADLAKSDSPRPVAALLLGLCGRHVDGLTGCLRAQSLARGLHRG